MPEDPPQELLDAVRNLMERCDKIEKLHREMVQELRNEMMQELRNLRYQIPQVGYEK